MILSLRINLLTLSERIIFRGEDKDLQQTGHDRRRGKILKNSLDESFGERTNNVLTLFVEYVF